MPLNFCFQNMANATLHIRYQPLTEINVSANFKINLWLKNAKMKKKFNIIPSITVKK